MRGRHHRAPACTTRAADGDRTRASRITTCGADLYTTVAVCVASSLAPESHRILQFMRLAWLLFHQRASCHTCSGPGARSCLWQVACTSGPSGAYEVVGIT